MTITTWILSSNSGRANVPVLSDSADIMSFFLEEGGAQASYLPWKQRRETADPKAI